MSVRKSKALQNIEWLSPTLPQAAVQLHPHAHGGGQLGDGQQADVAGDDWGVKVFEDGGVGIFVALDNLHTHSMIHIHK